MTKVLQIICMQGVVVSATTTVVPQKWRWLRREHYLVLRENLVLIVVLVLETKAQ